MVVLKALNMAKSENSSEIVSMHAPGVLQRGTGERKPGRAAAESRPSHDCRQAQASCFGGFFVASGLKPEGPTVASSAFCQSPESIIFLIASFTLPHSSVSPFFRPTPYRSSEKVLPTTFSLPWFAGWAAKPARITLSVVTASTAPPVRASTHLE